MEERIEIYIERNFPEQREMVKETLIDHESMQDIANDYLVYVECLSRLEKGVTVRETGLRQFYRESSAEIEGSLSRMIRSISTN